MEHIKNGEVKLIHIARHDQVANISTMSLPRVMFENLKKMIEMKDEKGLNLVKY